MGIPLNMLNSIDFIYPKVRYTYFFESMDYKTEKEKILTSDLNILIGLSRVVSTAAEIESAKLFDKEEYMKRLILMEKELKSERQSNYGKGIPTDVPYSEKLTTTMFSSLSLSEKQQPTSAKASFLQLKGMTTTNKEVSNQLELSSSFPKLPQHIIDNLRVKLGFEKPEFEKPELKNIVKHYERESPLPKRRKISNRQRMSSPQLGCLYQRKVVPPSKPTSRSTVYEMFMKMQQNKAKKNIENEKTSTSELAKASDLKEVLYENQNHSKNGLTDFVLQPGRSRS